MKTTKIQLLSRKDELKREKNIAKIKTRNKESVIPVVGIGATTGAGSDCYPHTIIEVANDLSFIVIQSDNATATKGSDYYSNQSYTYSPNKNGSTSKYTLRKNGRYMREGSPLKNYWCGVGVGTRRYYQDPSF